MGILRKNKRTNGFTLLEVMIAIGILAIGLVVLLQAHVMNLRMCAHSQLSTRAMLLAERKVVELEAGEMRIPGEREGDFGKLHPGFLWKELITPVRIGNRVLSGLSRVEVVVSWKEGSREEEVKLVTYVAE
jgi:prepilin-type N-terminal cleavage/methylation domain-containing protein